MQLPRYDRVLASLVLVAAVALIFLLGWEVGAADAMGRLPTPPGGKESTATTADHCTTPHLHYTDRLRATRTRTARNGERHETAYQRVT